MTESLYKGFEPTMSFDLPAKLSIEKLAQQESRATLLLLVLNPPGASELSELVKNLRFSNPTQVGIYKDDRYSSSK